MFGSSSGGSGGGLSTNDGSFAKESSGNLALVASNTTSEANNLVSILARLNATLSNDVIDRASRALGVVSIGNTPTVQQYWYEQALTPLSGNGYLLQDFDVHLFKEATVHVTGVFSATVNWYGSNDNTGTNRKQLYAIQTDSIYNYNENTGSTGIYKIPLGFHYLTLTVSGYTSGTVGGSVDLSMMSSLPLNQFVQASFAGSVPFRPVSNSSPTQVASSAASVQLIGANSNRQALYITNDATSVLYVLLGGGSASVSNYTAQVPPNGGFYELPVYPIWTGAAQGIWSSATSGGAKITELS